MSFLNPFSFGMFMFFILGILLIWIYFNPVKKPEDESDKSKSNNRSSVGWLIGGIILLLISISSYPLYLYYI